MFKSNTTIKFNEYCVIFLNIRKYRKKVANKNNIGIKHRLSIFSQENPELDQLEIDDKSLDELETELNSGRDIVNLHRRNIAAMKKELDLKIIERKYFDKVKTPNFLTWSEKEQIRGLHASDPSLWTFEKLSQCFPATPDIIKKVIKGSWRPREPERILKHDENVSKNWAKLKKGEIHLDPLLRQHLTLFSSREYIQHLDDGHNHIKMKTPALIKGSEFVKIITDCQKELKDDNLLIDKEKNVRALPTKSEDNKYESISQVPVLNKNVKSRFALSKKMITLDELRKNMKEENSFSEYSEYDQMFLKGAESGTNTLSEVDEYESIPAGRSKTDKKIQALAKVINETPKDEPIPLKIKVPSDLPKGTVYKVNDIYYDTDGKFLYRVPGMK